MSRAACGPARRRRRLVGFVGLVACAAALPWAGCSHGAASPTSPASTTAAAIAVGIESQPLAATGDPARPWRANWLVTIADNSSVGGRVMFVNATLRDAATGAEVVPSGKLSLTGADIVALGGTDVLPAEGSVRVQQGLAFALPSGGRGVHLSVSVRVDDDHGNSLGASDSQAVE